MYVVQLIGAPISQNFLDCIEPEGQLLYSFATTRIHKSCLHHSYVVNKPMYRDYVEMTAGLGLISDRFTDLFSCHSIQASSGAYPASCVIGIGAVCTGEGRGGGGETSIMRGGIPLPSIHFHIVVFKQETFFSL